MLIDIHNKLIFDSLSNALEEYQIENPRITIGPSNLIQRHQGQGVVPSLIEILAKARRRVEQWAMLRCGPVFKEIPLEREPGALPEGYWQGQEEQLNQLREKRLNASLKMELSESHQRWMDVRDEALQVTEDISELVFENVLNEFLNEIS